MSLGTWLAHQSSVAGIGTGVREGATGVDMVVDLPKLRHGRPARALRGVVSRALMGRGGWPIVFRAPQLGDQLGVSEHLYVHVPFCARICLHCPYNKIRYRTDLHRAYGAALDRELTAYLGRDGRPPVRSLYFGGGTPSMTPDLIHLVIDKVEPWLRPGAEVGVEVHPRDCDATTLRDLRRIGVTRISVGVETFRTDLLRLLGRGYTGEQAVAALEQATQAGFECVDANLIYAIPGQAIADTATDAARCLAIGVDQISAYPLLTFPHTPLGRRSAAGRFAGYGERARLRTQHLVSRTCRAGGLDRTSVWSFTRPGISPYSTVTHEDYVGFGAGAGSKVAGVFWFNTFSVPAYCATTPTRPALVMEATEQLQRLHWLYWQIYRTFIDAGRYQALFGRDLRHDLGPTLRMMRMLGWISPDPAGWRVTESGAVWGHRLQALYSLTYIDDLWQRCQHEPWPERVLLA